MPPAIGPTSGVGAASASVGTPTATTSPTAMPAANPTRVRPFPSIVTLPENKTASVAALS